ncbi:Histone-like developmental protein [Chlamydiales bacterium STE3]|nr:Histone-like developmental protein [Chlamydiales bacterium STE3]
MALKDTIKQMRELLNGIAHDLEKADGGNKAASQRVRTGTVKLEKIAKHYRKESIKSEKTTKGPKKASSAKKAPAKKAAPASKKPVATKKPAPKKTVKANPKAKIHKARPSALSFKKPTAKLPSRRAFR